MTPNTISSRSSASREVEYEAAIDYIRHMYDTRHTLFQFMLAFNGAVLAVTFQAVTSVSGRVFLSFVALMSTVALAMMAQRSWRFLLGMEQYVEELEIILGFGLVTQTNLRMPKGARTTVYLFFVYWLMAVLWLVLIVYFLCAPNVEPVLKQ